LAYSTKGTRTNAVRVKILFGMLIAFNKPFGVLSQFTEDGSPNRTLGEFNFPPRVYPIGRLDADSEGLLLLSDESALNARLLHPRQGHARIYWVQVEGIPTSGDLEQLSLGVIVQGRKTLPCRAGMLDPQPQVPARIPPIRVRKTVPDCWISLELVEGKNRQVRRMTAAIGYPTLRLIRVQIGDFAPQDLEPGQWRALSKEERALVFANSEEPPSPAKSLSAINAPRRAGFRDDNFR
jgi:23S rRNA pseudouridine2457 synthase